MTHDKLVKPSLSTDFIIQLALGTIKIFINGSACKDKLDEHPTSKKAGQR